MQGCPSCMAHGRADQSALSLLKSLDDISPDARVWDRLSQEIRPRRAAFSFPMKVAAAAGIFAAAFSFAFAVAALRPARVASIASVAPGSPFEPGYAIRTNERLVTPTFALLSLPDVGTLKLNRDTAIVFESPRRVRLERGELFASIRPDVKGFVVESGGQKVTVHGTRFGVRGGDEPAVYVVDGRVDVSGPSGRVVLTDHQMAGAGGSPRPLEDEALRWLAVSESPVVALVAECGSGSSARAGEPLELTVKFETGSPAPVLLPPLDELLPLIRLKVTDAAGKPYLVRVPASALWTSAFRTRGANGPVRLDVCTPCALSLRISPDLLPPSGRIRICATYQPGAARGGDFWDREIVSDPLEIEVR